MLRRTTWVGMGIVACAACSSAQTAPQSAATVEKVPAAHSPEAAELTPSQKMWQHFDDVNEARNAVVAGELSGIQAPLARVAAGEWGIEVPEHWMPDLDEMKLIASRAPRAESLEDAAELIANLTHVCAECHRTNRGGPELPQDRVGYPDQDQTLRDTMARHAWAADELWLGLTAPDYQAWNRGVEAVEGGMFLFPGEVVDESATEEPLAADLGGLRAWAVEAQQAELPTQREALYAELLVDCATCHVRTGVRIGGGL